MLENIHPPFQRQALLLGQDIAECTTVEILHYQISDGLAARLCESEVSNIDNVGMAQATGSACFAFEARHKLRVTHELRGDQLERNVAFSAEMTSQINGTHPAPAQQSLQAILFVKHLADVVIQINHSRRYATA